MPDNISKSIKDLYSTPSLIYKDELPLTQKMLDVWGGSATLREGATKYLPKNRFETADDYDMRLRTLAIKNYLKDAVTGYVGRIFSKETTLGDDMSEEARAWWEDIDRQGNKGDVFFKRVVTAGIRDGIAWVLVDMPVSSAQTLAEERESGIRPYCRLYQKIDVIYVQIDETGRVTDFRAKETDYETRGMEQVKVERIRRFTPGLCELYNITDEVMEMQAIISFPTSEGVPVVPYITDPDPKAGLYTESPMKDMAELIVRLWRSQGEQDNSLSVARCPMLFGRGLQLEQLIVSARSVISSDDPNADVRWIESTGSALQAGENDITTLKTEIEAESLKPLKQADNTRTRYEAKSDDAKTTSPIKNMADAAQDMIENVLRCMALWNGESDGGSVSLNSNFDLVDFDASETTLLSNMRARGDITLSTFLKEMKRRGVLSDDLDIDEEMEAVRAEGHGEEDEPPGGVTE